MSLYKRVEREQHSGMDAISAGMCLVRDIFQRAPAWVGFLGEDTWRGRKEEKTTRCPSVRRGRGVVPSKVTTRNPGHRERE